MRARAGTFVLLVTVGLALSGSAPLAQSPDPGELIDRAEALSDQRHEMATLSRMIELYDRALPHLDELSAERQRTALNRLTQLHYERSSLRPGSGSEDRADLNRAKDVGFRRLRRNDGFAEHEHGNFREALSHVEDPAALLWTANAWGHIFRHAPLDGLANVGKVLAMYERCMAIDETFWGGNCVHALGALLVTTPAPLGGNRERGRELLDRAVEIDPEYLVNHTVRAAYLGFRYDALGNKNGVRDRELIERELRIIEESPIGDWPFWNRIAKQRVPEIRRDLERLSD
ncbi:MAG: TRAP transporter TatT component family protein [Candidatus Bipolaricaulia bacterium]